MCLVPNVKMPKQNEPPPPPPPAPPAPEPTASGLTVGENRAGAPPIKNFLRKAIGGKKNSLVIPVGGTDASASTGINIPR
jgi:hypothetical protein